MWMTVVRGLEKLKIMDYLVWNNPIQMFFFILNPSLTVRLIWHSKRNVLMSQIQLAHNFAVTYPLGFENWHNKLIDCFWGFIYIYNNILISISMIRLQGSYGVLITRVRPRKITKCSFEHILIFRSCIGPTRSWKVSHVMGPIVWGH